MSDESPTDTYTASFKTHPGYDASLIVVRGNTVEELVANAQALTNGDTSALQVVVDVQNTLHAINNVSAPDVPAPAPQASEPAPAGAAEVVRVCSHGKRVRKTGNSAKGAWAGWFCPLPKGSPDQCKPDWE
jgi:hypothetical protein